MKKILSVIALIALAACRAPEPTCSFSKVHILTTGTATKKVYIDKTIIDCFTANTPDDNEPIEIKGKKTSDTFGVTYSQSGDLINLESRGILSVLSKRRGYAISISGTQKSDTLTLTFSDRNITKIKGVISFTK